MDSIYYVEFMGRHIDLSKITSISNAYFIDRMGFGGWYVGLDITFQLQDKSLEYERKYEFREYSFGPNPEHNGRTEHMQIYVPGTKTPIAVWNLQCQVAVLIEAWREYKKSLEVSQNARSYRKGQRGNANV